MAIRKFHHMGVAVRDLDGAIPIYQSLFGYHLVSGPFHDPIQRVKVCFLARANEADAIVLELIAPVAHESPVTRMLAKGIGAYHLCYTVAAIEQTLLDVRSQGCMVVSEPVPAVAFGGKRIAWFVTPSRQLIELVEE